MTPRTEVLDDIIGTLDPEDIPVEFILMAKVTDLDGRERVLRGSELAQFLNHPFNVAEVRVLLDVKAIRAAIIDYVREVYEEVARLSREG